MGLRNLEACKSVGKEIESKRKKPNKLELFDQKPVKNRYIDYLSETRKSREQKSEGHPTRFSKSFRSDVNEVKKIMK